MSLRERVAEAMWDDSREYYMRIADIGTWEEADPPTVDFNLRQADAAIEAVFTELLSDEALEAAADIWNHHHAPTCDRAIKAALTAIGVSIE